MKYLKSFEDVYYEKTPIRETDEERNNRIQKWVEQYVDELVGSDIVDVWVSNRMIKVHYKKSERWENRKSGGRGPMSREDAMAESKREWKETGEDMVDQMKYDHNQGVENGLGLDLGDDYVVVASPNGYYVESEQDFPKNITGYSSGSVIG